MPRWEAGARARLTQAAYELYFERGFEDVTVAEIATRAGLTKRTFFRYFEDKREVLFSGASAFQEAVVGLVVDASEDVAPIDAVVAALAAGGSTLTELGEGARGRQRLIDSSSELQEREMIKMVALTRAIDDALQRRGVPESVASITAQAGVAVFQTAFERWARQDAPEEFSHLIYSTLDELRAAVHPAVPDGSGAARRATTTRDR
jgi:AcrR family transcriptional regulator